MTVTVDSQPLDVAELQLETFADVLTHVQQNNRLITSLVIDGDEPELQGLAELKERSIAGHTVFIETSDPHEIAAEVLGELERSLDDAEAATAEAVELLRKDQPADAMDTLGDCFTVWQQLQEALVNISNLLKVDLAELRVEGRPFSHVLEDFAEQLRMIRESLENRDFVTLIDTLTYETTETSTQWRAAMRTLRGDLAA